jgi:hypothetical protein
MLTLNGMTYDHGSEWMYLDLAPITTQIAWAIELMACDALGLEY